MNSPKQPLLHRCDRRGIHAMQLTAMIMNVLDPYLDAKEYGEVVLELQNLMWSQGVQVITEAERIAAGRPPRNHYGMTLEELAILEQRQIDAMLRPTEVMMEDHNGIPSVGQIPQPDLSAIDSGVRNALAQAHDEINRITGLPAGALGAK